MARTALPNRAPWGVAAFTAVAALVLVAAVSLMALLGVLALSAPDASAQSGYTVSISDGEIDSASGQTTVILRLEPGPAGVAAISIDVVIDESAIRVTEVNALAAGGLCNPVEPSAQFAGFNVTGWFDPIDLCEITFVSLGGSGSSPVTPVVTTAVGPTNDPVTRQPIALSGSTVAGTITVGSAAPAPTSTRPPTTVATATPEPEPTAEPEPTEVPEQPTEVPADPTAEPVETGGSDPDVPDAAESDDTDGGEADGEPTPDPIAEPIAEPTETAASAEGTDEDDDRGSRATTELIEPTVDAEAAAATEPLSEPAVDEESAAPVLPESDDSGEGADAVQTDQDDLPPLSDENQGSNTALLATVAIGLLVVGGGFAAATRRANRNND